MRNLLKFLLRYHAVFLFVLLEFIAFLMIFQQNNYHNAVFVNSSSKSIGFINKQISAITSYINLQKENQILQDENLRLRQMLEQKTATSPAYENTYIQARVINKSINKKKNYLTIDKGALYEVNKHTGIIGASGIVGIVENRSAHFASVIPIINTNFHVSAQLKKNNYYGSISWDGKNYRLVDFDEIPNYVDVQKGDTVVTSGYSKSFPQGIMIGTIHSAKKSNANAFWEIKVELSTDFKSLDQVYAVKKALIKEQEVLENMEENHD